MADVARGEAALEVTDEGSCGPWHIREYLKVAGLQLEDVVDGGGYRGTTVG